MRRICLLWLCVGVLGMVGWPGDVRAQHTLWETYTAAGKEALDRGHKAEAEQQFRIALREAEDFGSTDPRLALSLFHLGQLYLLQEKDTEAVALLTRALAIQEKALRPDHPDLAETLSWLGEAYYDQGKYAEATALIRRAIPIQDKGDVGSQVVALIISRNTLARLYKVQGKFAEAAALYRQRLTYEEQGEKPDDLGIAHALTDLASLYRDQGRYGQAETLYKRALTLTEKALASSNLGNAFMVLESYAVLLRRTNRPEAAAELEARAQAIYPPALLAELRQQSAQEPSRLSGATVQRIQQLLAALGYAPGTPDGVYGPQTRAAVLAFHRDTGLPVSNNMDKPPPAFLEYLEARVGNTRGIRPTAGQR